MSDNNNPLIPAVLQVLRAADEQLAIHQLLQRIKNITTVPVLDEDAQLALFKLNWLMMNALYSLQSSLLDDGYYLHISTLDIHLQALPVDPAGSTERQLQHDRLRSFYLDWRQFSDTTRDEVEALMDGVWRHYTSDEQLRRACHVLELDGHDDIGKIRRNYRRLASRHHPDRGGDARQFMAVREAYEVLLKARR
ncbi:MAG TPA: DNA-J related domain-containing protein [Pseudomonadales bacterium]